MRLMSLMIRLSKSMLELKLNSAIDYEDILANVDDYEYPYNHINRNNFIGITLTRTHAYARTRVI